MPKNIRTLYHGTSQIIEMPKYGKGKKYNDYGIGFYCTQQKNMACEWAVSQQSDGYLNEYRLDINNMDILNLNVSEYNILHWLTILLENRTFSVQTAIAKEAKQYLLDNFGVDYKKRDIIIGYRADDSYFAYAQDFINNTISYRQLEKAMKLGRLGEQFVVKSEKAFNNIEYVGSEVCKSTEWISKKEARDLEARKEYFDLEKNSWQRGDIYMMQILDEEMKANDSRL